MLSVYDLVSEVVRSGAVFSRDPWSGHVGLVGIDRVPSHVVDGLRLHWGELEALLAERRPPDIVSIAERIIAESRQSSIP